MIKNCLTCQKEFERRTHGKAGEKKFCSSQCYWVSKKGVLKSVRKWNMLVCITCKAEFYPHIKNGKLQKYCSPPCYFKDKKGNPNIMGENNYQWKKNRTEYQDKCLLRASVRWKEWRRAVFERDRYTCQECGRVGVYLESHHIIPVRTLGLDSPLLFEITNGITLCRPCHTKTMRKELNFVQHFAEKVAAQMLAY
jgi:5-methylcytosine-specific restriction endonuclease McrA